MPNEKDLNTAEIFSALAMGLGTPGSVGSNLGQVGMKLTAQKKEKLSHIRILLVKKQ